MKEIQKNSLAGKNKFYNMFRWLLLIVSIIIIIYFIVYIIISLNDISDVQTLDINVKVGDYIGFNLDPGSLNFGTVLPGSGSIRTVTLKSDKPLRVHISFEGETTKWINVSKNDFILNGTDNLNFYVNVPGDVSMDNYTGKAVILFTKL